MDDVLNEKIDALGDLIRSVEDDHYPTCLDRVQVLRMIAETAESALCQAVPLARADGASWEAVAGALGVSRQSAHERFRTRC